MSIIRDTTVAIQIGTSPFTWSHTCTGTNLCLFVGFTLPHGATLSAVTYNGSSMSQLSTVSSTVSGQTVNSYIYGLVAPSTGANTVSITWTGSVSNASGGSVSYQNVSQSGLPDSQNTATVSSGSTVTISTTTIANHAAAIAYVNSFSGFSSSPAGSGSTLLGTIGITSGLFESSSLNLTPAGVQSMTANMSSPGVQGNGMIVSFASAPVVYTVVGATGVLVLTGFGAFLHKFRSIIGAVGTFIVTGFNAVFTLKHHTINNQTKHTDSWNNEQKS